MPDTPRLNRFAQRTAKFKEPKSNSPIMKEWRRAFAEARRYWDAQPILLADPDTQFASLPTAFTQADEEACFGHIEPPSAEMLADMFP